MKLAITKSKVHCNTVRYMHRNGLLLALARQRGQLRLKCICVSILCSKH